MPYDPFGISLLETGSFEQPFGFSTKRTDPRTGLVFFQYRLYDPPRARWLTRDPLGEAGGLNLYAFVGNNPVNWVDPWGLEYAEYYAVMFGIGGGVTGAALVGSGGAAICSPSGPGAAVCALVGGKGGAVAGTALGTAFGYALGSTIDTASLWWPILSSGVSDYLCDSPFSPYLFSKGGTQNKKDTGLSDLTDEQIEEALKHLTGEEKRRYEREQKARGIRNKQKRQKKRR